MQSSMIPSWAGGNSHFVILSSMLRGSRIKVGKTTRLRSAPGLSWEMMWERTINGLKPSEAGQRDQRGRDGECANEGMACMCAASPERQFTHHCPDRARQRGCHRQCHEHDCGTRRRKSGRLRVGQTSWLTWRLTMLGWGKKREERGKGNLVVGR